MNKQIKIIDLLCLISDSEEAPKKIRYGNIAYTYDEYCGEWGYVNKEKEPYKWFANVIDCDIKECLNDEVEILDEEEDKDIPLIPDDELYIIEDNLGKVCDKPIEEQLDWNFRILKEKINQVVEEFNEYRKENE